MARCFNAINIMISNVFPTFLPGEGRNLGTAYFRILVRSCTFKICPISTTPL